MIASPQRCNLHVVRHVASAALEFITPRSHCSPFATSMMLLPHVSSDRQSPEQPSPETVLLSSHTSPTVLSSTPLPHTSRLWQSAEQPSPEMLLPSSQTS